MNEFQYFMYMLKVQIEKDIMDWLFYTKPLLLKVKHFLIKYFTNS